ncbi:MAG TPA: hypothetical protein PKB14_09455 [Rubrivivax sp.]|nr:hypothetical protein [Rubrivivax sp.]
MNTSLLRSSCAMLAVVASAAAFAAPHGDSAMTEIANRAAPGEAAYGWRYFSDPAARHAVVINPAGEYFVSFGKGLQPVAGTGPAAQGNAPAMAELANRAAPGEAAYGWRYFSDPAARHAVVINPAGEYFVSFGKGLQPVAGTGTRQL